MKTLYPLINTLFQDDKTAILYQNEQLILKTALDNERELDKLLTQFVSYESHEIKEFNAAIEQFKKDLPNILNALRNMITEQEKINKAFLNSRQDFLTLCQHSINPEISLSDVNEMLLQHILTEEIFISIFSDAQFFQDNNIAKELYKVESTFFSGTTKRNTLSVIQHYYSVIKARSVHIADHHDKQFFLKSIYENFYKAYNSKAADRLGIVYTPHEIVKFQIESVDYLLEKHFKKSLADKDIKILDPCTGTGTYICDLIDYLPPKSLMYKYKHDIFANELGLLSYYIANLNIEYTYQQKMGEYVEFNNICWVDTLDNTGFGLKDSNTDLFGLTVENTERIKKQNSQKISVIIGNPPYNAKQENYNQQNANRLYKEIDAKIKNTYAKQGTAQNKNQVYDMYLRFFKWATDRLDDNGIIAFITNRSYLDAIAFDGVRLSMQNDFSFIYVIDLGGDITNKQDKLLATGNVFGIKTGVAIVFLVKKSDTYSSKVFYYKIDDCFTKNAKLDIISDLKMEFMNFDKKIPDEKGNWLNQTDNNFYDLLPLVSKDVKAGKGDNAVFRLFSRGVATQRDEWVYDFDKNNLENKIYFFVDIYQQTLKDANFKDKHLIKFDRELDKYLKQSINKRFESTAIIKSLYRPFSRQFFYFDKHFNGMTYQWNKLFGENQQSIGFISGISKPFSVLAFNGIADLNVLSPAAGGTQCLPLYNYDKEGNRHDNITDWALNQFKTHYANLPGFKNLEGLTKLDIFHYVYAVLHNPAYREKYELNLKREFPRIPFYTDFEKWVNIGKQLMDLHLNYETVTPYLLQREEINDLKMPKAKLKADKINGIIYLDDNTCLKGIPTIAWDYKLGNRSAVEWVLDQYKEKKPKDATIAEKFNTYRFTDYKEQVIDLLTRICSISVETVKLIEQLKALI